MALAKTSIAADIIVKPTPNPIKFNPPPPNLENNAISAKMPAIPANPFIIVSGSILPKPSTAFFITNNAADIIKSPVADVIPSLSNLHTRINIANSANNTPSVTKPEPITSGSIEPSFSNASAITIIAAPNITRPVAVDASLLEFLPNNFADATASPITTVNPKIPVSNCFGSSFPNFSIAAANINIDVENDKKNAEILIPPPPITSNLSIITKAATNSTMAAVIPANPIASLSPSMDEISNNAPANMAIAPAIFIKVLAFKSFW